MPTSRIQIDKRSFSRYRVQSEAAIRNAVTKTAYEGAAVVRAQSSDYEINEVLNSAKGSPAVPTGRGWASIVFLDHPLGIIFEKGSYRKLGGRKSSRGRSTDATGNRGVKPQRPLRKSLPAIRLLLMANIRREFR
jgi:hypothetical protein